MRLATNRRTPTLSSHRAQLARADSNHSGDDAISALNSLNPPADNDSGPASLAQARNALPTTVQLSLPSS
jgi:hypothetical protein